MPGYIKRMNHMPKYVFNGKGLFRYEQPDGNPGHAIKNIPFESNIELTDSCVSLVVEPVEVAESIKPVQKETIPAMKPAPVENDDDIIGINVANFLVKINTCTQVQKLDEYLAYENGLESPRTTVLNAISSKKTKLEATE